MGWWCLNFKQPILIAVHLTTLPTRGLILLLQYLLEQSRITTPAKEERNYHVFYQLLSGGDKDQYMLQPAESFEFLKVSDCYTLDGVDDTQVSLAHSTSCPLRTPELRNTSKEGIFLWFPL